MAPFVVALLALPLAAIAGDDVALLQQTSGPADSMAETLPVMILGESDHPASAALLGTEKVASEMSQAVEMLQARLGEMHRDQQRNLEAQDTMYTKRLQAQKLENEVVRNTNTAISENVAYMTKSNGEKRAKCKRTIEANEALRANLTDLKKDVRLAMDFVNHSMDEFEAANLDAPELQVLTQFDEADRRSELAKESKLPPKLSMLDQGRGGPRHEDPAEGLLKSLSESLEKLSEEEKEGAAKLKSNFMENYKAQAVEQSALRNEQAKLNATRSSLAHLEVRLDAALAHLGSVHKKLNERIAAALKFTWSMNSRRDQPAPLAQAQGEAVQSVTTLSTEKAALIEANRETTPKQSTPTQLTPAEEVHLAIVSGQ